MVRFDVSDTQRHSAPLGGVKTVWTYEKSSAADGELRSIGIHIQRAECQLDEITAPHRVR
jgi:hypothetical protein